MSRIIRPLKVIKHGTTVSCILATLFLTITCVYEYLLNKNTSSIDFKDFHADESCFYPSITLCFSLKDIFINGFNGKQYQAFLSGCDDSNDCNWNSSFSEVDYDSVTKRLSDYIIGEATYFIDKSTEVYIYRRFDENETHDISPKLKKVFGYTGGNRVYTSRRSSEQKCITLDIPFKTGKKVKYPSILFNKSMFADQSRPMDDDFTVSFQYPNQTLRQTSTKRMWTNDSKLLNQPCEDNDDWSCLYYGSSYTMMFDIDLVSVLKRRNKQGNPCISNWRNDNQDIRTRIAQKIKCKPSHWNLNLNLRNCSSKKEMKTSMEMEDYPTVPSCFSIERYAFSYSEIPGLVLYDIKNDEFIRTFGIDWKEKYMEDEIVSEIIINFVGNII